MMKKRILSLLLSAGLCISLLAVGACAEEGADETAESSMDAEAADAESEEAGEELSCLTGYASCLQEDDCLISQFTDTEVSGWYHDGVHFCLENGLMVGTSGTTFDPEGTTTRAMVVTILYRLEGSPEVSEESTFEDVVSGAWYEEAVAWAEESGIVNGYGNGLFGVSDAVTREQLAVIFYRYAEYRGQDLSASSDLLEFPDGEEVSSWAETELGWAVGENLIYGQVKNGETQLAPQGDSTRAMTATILLRFLTGGEDAETVYQSYHDMYEAYYEKILELQELHGEPYTADIVDYMFSTIGLSFAELLDFDGDGVEELVTAWSYYDDDIYEEFTAVVSTFAEIQVWKYEDGEVVLLYEGEEFQEHEGGMSPIYLTSVDGRWYLVQGSVECDFQIWGMLDGEFSMVCELQYDMENDDFHEVNGTKVTKEEYLEEYDYWLGSGVKYYFTGYYEGYYQWPGWRAVDALYDTIGALEEYLGLSTQN